MSFDELLAALFVALGGFALWAALYKPRWIPYLLAATLPCGNSLLDWYVQWSPGKVVLLAISLGLPLYYYLCFVKAGRLSSPRLPWLLWAFLAAQFLLTVVAYLFIRSNVGDSHMDATRSPILRPVVQLISEWTRVAALFAIIGWVRDREKVIRIYKTVLAITTGAALYGVYQIVGYYAGLPITGIARAQASDSGQYALTQIAGVGVFRVGSFIGEPKMLANWLAPSIVFIVCTKIFTSLGIRSRLTSYPVLILQVSVFILTFATGAYAGLCLGLLPIAWFWRGCRTKLARVVAVTVLVVASGWLIVSLSGAQLVQDIFVARTVDRFNEGDASLISDLAAVQLLSDHPGYLLGGVGAGNATFHIEDYVPEWIEEHFDTTVPLSISSMYLLLLVEGGVPVLLLFLLFLGGSLLHARKVALAAAGESDAALILTSMAICCMIAVLGGFYTTEGDGMLWFYWGLMLAACRVVSPSMKPRTAVVSTHRTSLISRLIYSVPR